MTSIFETYAAKICRQAQLPPATYEVDELNRYIMTLPLGEAHAALDGVELEALPRLGDTVTLTAHVQAGFFDIVRDATRELWEFTRPVLMKRQHLERLEGWREWRTLTVYLQEKGLEPCVVFRNTPLSLRTAPLETTDYYVADIRILLMRKQPYQWG